MAVDGVLFDFSGTLFRLDATPSWLSVVTAPDGTPLDDAARAQLEQRFASPISQSAVFDDEHRRAWDHRDLDPELNRKVFLEVLRQIGVTVPEQADALYQRLINPDDWRPYPDTAQALQTLAECEVPVAVVSNIAFDIRPAFERAGIDDHVTSYVLSYEHGVIKPDAAIFRLATDHLGVDPANTLMIGDHPDIDGAATGLGMRFSLVPPMPVEQRPDALLAALTEHGVVPR